MMGTETVVGARAGPVQVYESVVQQRSCHPGPSVHSWEASKSGVCVGLDDDLG